MALAQQVPDPQGVRRKACNSLILLTYGVLTCRHLAHRNKVKTRPLGHGVSTKIGCLEQGWPHVGLGRRLDHPIANR